MTLACSCTSNAVIFDIVSNCFTDSANLGSQNLTSPATLKIKYSIILIQVCLKCCNSSVKTKTCKLHVWNIILSHCPIKTSERRVKTQSFPGKNNYKCKTIGILIWDSFSLWPSSQFSFAQSYSKGIPDQARKASKANFQT